MTRLPRWHRACVGGMGGTAAAGGMGGTAAEQVVYRVENVGLFVVPSDGSTPAQRISQPLIAGGAVLSDFAIKSTGRASSTKPTPTPMTWWSSMP